MDSLFLLSHDRLTTSLYPACRSGNTTYYPSESESNVCGRRCCSTPALNIFVAYAPTSSYEEDEDVEAFHMDLKKFYREDHAFYKVIIDDFNAKIGPR
ncbi:hypothetical protein RB195_011312 [Necator americanus]|uniref:Uncharacterized protein n=1 Tax=Necator americanus TaxID=51031 RepID=A0ABR1D2Z6_NECAM